LRIIAATAQGVLKPLERKIEPMRGLTRVDRCGDPAIELQGLAVKPLLGLKVMTVPLEAMMSLEVPIDQPIDLAA
jgi:hypothetical protein